MAHFYLDYAILTLINSWLARETVIVVEKASVQTSLILLLLISLLLVVGLLVLIVVLDSHGFVHVSFWRDKAKKVGPIDYPDWFLLMKRCHLSSHSCWIKRALR